MQIHKDSFFTIYFGNATNSRCTIKEAKSAVLPTASPVQQQELHTKLNQIATDHKVPHLIFSNQTHGINHTIITEKNFTTITPFTHESDSLITNQPIIGLAKLTADCLPLVLVDRIHKVVANIHAGWKSSLGGIVTNTIEQLKTDFNSDPKSLQVFFGPCAHACCYEVSPDFGKQAHRPLFLKQSLIHRNDKVFFDNLCYTNLVLDEAGVLPERRNHSYTQCTICNLDYCSYRRNKEISGLQSTIVVIDKTTL